MSQKSPVPQAVSFVSQVLKRDRMRDAAHVPELEKDAASGSMDRVGYPPPASNLFRTVNTWRARITPALLRNLRAFRNDKPSTCTLRIVGHRKQTWHLAWASTVACHGSHDNAVWQVHRAKVQRGENVDAFSHSAFLALAHAVTK
jgi:hypothetical protein